MQNGLHINWCALNRKTLVQCLFGFNSGEFLERWGGIEEALTRLLQNNYLLTTFP